MVLQCAQAANSAARPPKRSILDSRLKTTTTTTMVSSSPSSSIRCCRGFVCFLSLLLLLRRSRRSSSSLRHRSRRAAHERGPSSDWTSIKKKAVLFLRFDARRKEKNRSVACFFLQSMHFFFLPRFVLLPHTQKRVRSDARPDESGAGGPSATIASKMLSYIYQEHGEAD